MKNFFGNYKKLKIITVIILAAIIMVLTVTTILVSCGDFLCAKFIDSAIEKPAEPTVTYGEFPFEITFKIDGKEVVFKDTYICEYKGLEWNISQGYYMVWDGYIKQTGENEIVVLTDGDKKIVCYVGKPEYYLNAPNYSGKQYLIPELRLVEPREQMNPSISELTVEMKEYYGIEIVDWKFSEPIENS